MTVMSPPQENPYCAPTPPVSPPRDTPANWYGWVHVALGVAAMIGTLPGRTHGLGLITEPLLADLQLDRGVYADINLWATLLGAAFCWPAGILLDCFGVRRVQAGIAVALGAVVIAMASVTHPLAFFFLITLTRALGQSMLSVASLTLVGKSFGSRLSLAMGAYSLLVGLGFGVAFKSAGRAVLEYGWRPTWVAIGMILIFGLAPATWLLVRSKIPAPSLPLNGACAATDFTVGQALRSFAFWAFAVASSIYGLISSGIALFNQAILVERGFEAQTYHNVLAVSSICGMAFNLAGGWAATRLGLGRLLAASMLLLAGSLAALPRLSELWQVYLYALALGAAGGIVTVSFFTVWGAAFGQTHLGKIQGWAQMMTVVASAAGPKLFAECHARTGSYLGLFYAFVPIALVLALAAWLAKLPRPSAASALAAEEELQLATS